MILQTAIQVSGVFLLGLAAAHAVFPRLFRWKDELRGLSLLNRQMFLVHCFFIALLLAALGLLCLLYSEQLLQKTDLSRALLGGMAIFWFLRLIVQIFIYDSSLWRGNSLRTAAHVAFTSFCIFLVVVYASAYFIVSGFNF